MKTIFEEACRTELIQRIHTIGSNSQALWGKMNVYQMLRHCTIWEEWIQGIHQPQYNQEWLGRIFGKMALKSMIKNEKPFAKNIPTLAAFKVNVQELDLEAEKNKWITLIEGYTHYSNPRFIHDFFGKMTLEQVGILAYKHSDHHLRQFNC